MVVWKDIIGFDGYYQISSTGQIKSLQRTVPHPLSGTQEVHERILKSCLNNKGYPFVALTKRNKRTNLFIHRLVAMHFIPNVDNKLYVNHINGNPGDFRIENLEWCTMSENHKHAFRIGLKHNKKGADDELSKAIIAIKKDTKEEVKFGSQREASRELKIAQSSIWRILNNQLKTDKYNYSFKYADTSIPV